MGGYLIKAEIALCHLACLMPFHWAGLTSPKQISTLLRWCAYARLSLICVPMKLTTCRLRPTPSASRVPLARSSFSARSGYRHWAAPARKWLHALVSGVACRRIWHKLCRAVQSEREPSRLDMCRPCLQLVNAAPFLVHTLQCGRKDLFSVERQVSSAWETPAPRLGFSADFTLLLSCQSPRATSLVQNSSQRKIFLSLHPRVRRGPRQSSLSPCVGQPHHLAPFLDPNSCHIAAPAQL
jgi:hypothetical protein